MTSCLGDGGHAARCRGIAEGIPPHCVRQMPPNGLELREAALWASCPAALGPQSSLYGNLATKTSHTFPHASRVSCSELII